VAQLPRLLRGGERRSEKGESEHRTEKGGG
jgi:hypothetical protein